MATLKRKPVAATVASVRERLAKNRAATTGAGKPKGQVAKPLPKGRATRATPAKVRARKAPAKVQRGKPAAAKRPPVLKPPASAAKDLLTQAKAKQRMVANRARADLEETKKLLARIQQDFYEAGTRLKRLKEPAAYKALGYVTFAALVEKELGISASVANRLVAIVENVSRELALSVGQSHASALVELAQATWEEDTPDELATKTIELPTGERLHVRSASVRAKHAAAAALRQARGKAPVRGTTTAPDERKVAREVESKLRALGVKTAKVRAHATRRGQPAELRLLGIPVTALDKLCQAICGP